MDKTKGGGIGEPKFAAEVTNKSHNGSGVKSDNLNKLVTEKLKSCILEWIKAEKVRASVGAQSQLGRVTLMVIGAIGIVLCAAVVLEFTIVSDTMSSRFLALRSSHSGFFGPPERVYENNGYLMVSSNGGLNQMRAGISDMVAIARYLNVTFIIPQLDNTSFWNDRSQFEDIFDVDYFIQSLKDEVRILKQLPPEMKAKFKQRYIYSMPPVSWSNMSYYYDTVLPRIKKHQVIHFVKTDARIANNGIPEEVQKLRCRVNYKAMRFTPQIEEVGKKIVNIMRQKGPFLVLHLRYEMDMLAFSGCYESLNETEMEELTKMS